MQQCTMVQSASSRVMMAIQDLGLKQGDVSIMVLGLDKILLAKVGIACTRLTINTLMMKILSCQQSDKATIKIYNSGRSSIIHYNAP